MKKYLLSLFLLSTVVLNAQFVENFTYTSTGTTAGDSLTSPILDPTLRWKKHSGTLSGTAPSMTTPGLTFAGYTGSGVGNAVTLTHGSGSRQDINAAIGPFDSTTTYPNTDSSVYYSFIVKPVVSGGGANTRTGDYFIHLAGGSGANVGTEFRARVFIKDTANNAGFCRIGFSKLSATTSVVWSNEMYPLGSNLLIVVKYKYVTGPKNDITTAYIFKEGDPFATEPSIPTITAIDNTTENDINPSSGIQSICLRQGSTGTGSVVVDGIRVALSWPALTLPVKLSSFNAIGLQNQVNLNWITASEVNSQNFEVERSIDGINFTKVSTVAARGISTRSTNYQTTDKNLPSSNTLYYRLKSVSVNGSFEYSGVQKVTLKATSLSISPNPAKSIVYINANSLVESAELTDMMGKRIFATQNNKTNSVMIDVSKLPNGNYALKTIIDGTSKVQKVVVAH